MPRPKNGYTNSAGDSIPGTHDPIKRFMNQEALKVWAWKQGKAGKSLYDREAINIGTCVHTMVELDLQGRPEADIRFYAEQTLRNPEDMAKADAAFRAWKAWSDNNHVRPYAQEIPLVSEEYQFGGTPDLIATIGNGLGLLDFKTSAKGAVYPDMLIAMAAHGKLWRENHPDKPLTAGYHLIVLPKDGSGFKHFVYADLKPHWKLFRLYLRAYHMDKACSEAKALAGIQAQAAAPIEAEAKRTPSKPRIKVEAPSRPMTIGEMLRAYGHVKEATA